MSSLRPAAPGASFFVDYFGFIPRLFRAQSYLPRVVEAEAAIAAAILGSSGLLSQVQKERLVLAIAAAHGNVYWATLACQTLSVLGVDDDELGQIVSASGPSRIEALDAALIGLAVKVAFNDVSAADVAKASAHGWNDQSILEAVLVASWANLACMLSAGLAAEPDFERVTLGPVRSAATRPGAAAASGSYIPASELSEPLMAVREIFGFVPNVFRCQAMRTDVIDAELFALRTVLHNDEVLTRKQKECIVMAVSAANRNTYYVALERHILRGLGLHDPDRITLADKALLDAARQLTADPRSFGSLDLDRLRRHGFREEQILEAVVTTSLTAFFNTVQAGTGAEPDFPVDAEILNLLRPDSRHSQQSIPTDPDAEVVARIQQGDVDAFEELMERHSLRVYRTLVGVLGSADEARDALQDTFLKAFQHVSDFEGRSKFSTWLVSIANNTGIQRLRDRDPGESLDDTDSDAAFRPKELRAWTDDPEQLYAKAETKALVEQTVMRLPVKYRVVVMLRDIEQLSTDEVATALGLGTAAVKARVLRGRLMLREALAPHFARAAKGGAA